MLQRQKGPTLASRGGKGWPRTRRRFSEILAQNKRADRRAHRNPASAVIANRSLIVEASTP